MKSVFNKKFHESKESLVREAFEHEPKLRKVPHDSNTYGKVPTHKKVKF